MKKEAGIIIILLLSSLFLWSCTSSENSPSEDSLNQTDVNPQDEQVAGEAEREALQEISEQSQALTNDSEGEGTSSVPGECGGWRCLSSKTKIFQNPDCTFGERKDCYYGCDNNDCRPPPICEPGWKCQGSTIRAYQEKDCTWIQETRCPSGCENADCLAESNASSAGSTTSTPPDSTPQDEPVPAKSYDILPFGVIQTITVEGKEHLLRIVNMEAARVRIQVDAYKSDWLNEGQYFLTQDEVKITIHEIFLQPYQGGKQEITYEAQ